MRAYKSRTGLGNPVAMQASQLHLNKNLNTFVPGGQFYKLCKDMCVQHHSVPPANTQIIGTNSKKKDHAIKVLDIYKPSRSQGIGMQVSKLKANAMQKSELCRDICVQHHLVQPANTQIIGANSSTKEHAIKVLEAYRPSQGQGIAMHELCKDVCVQHILVPPANTQTFGAKPSTKDHAIKALDVFRTWRGQGNVMQASKPFILIPKTKEQIALQTNKQTNKTCQYRVVPTDQIQRIRNWYEHKGVAQIRSSSSLFIEKQHSAQVSII